ncbi:Cell wall-binding protein [Candidatus Desulfosporosinus infrequens]|uniref:Cell wall-binding protein n=1 Tax=Candidatus Desulfosporosinus infrequens TaxID=2043169 RepID=A0A2U3LAV4_9FIRM|nr:Cell wall-binding protein [Candidatus Desulfosporosinus infrequens]
MKKEIKQILLGALVMFLTVISIFLPVTAAAATSDQTDSKLTRIYGNDRYETAAKIAEAGWQATSNYAIVAPGMDSNLIDALTAGPLAAKLNAPILLTEEDSLNSFARQELTRLAVKTVFITITTGPGVNLQNVIKQIKAIPTVTDVEMLGGSDTAQTSVNIANELASLGTKISRVIIVGGSGVDALSVSPIAGAQGIPILYTFGKSLSNCVSDYLNGLKFSLNKIYVIGGTGVISDAVASQLPGSVDRVAGIDRYDTNRQVLKKFNSILNYKSTYLANGETLVDALAVSPLAALSGSPILLTSQSLPSASAAYAQANLSSNVVALGGASVVSAAVLAQLSSVQVINQDGISQGPNDPNNPSPINSVLKITGNHVTLSNSSTNDSINIQGNDVTLNNVTSKGTIIVDPGATGTALLQNVTAENIVVLSGGFSVDLQNVTADALMIASSSDVYLISSGTTSISQTTSTSSADLDNSGGGSFGQITISSASANNSSSQTVTLQGTYTNVVVDSPINLTLGSNTTLQVLANNAKANIVVPSSSSITNQTTNNQVATAYGEDSGTTSNDYGDDFYIGQLGYGTLEHFDAATGGDDAGGNFFNSVGATNATWVYGYWLLSGLSVAPAGTSATDWGQQQAQAANKAFIDMHNKYGSKVKLVIFADVEACGGGLDSEDFTNNQAIYTAFVDGINQKGSAKTGTYSSPHEWNTQSMGTNFTPLTPGYYWVADYPGGTPDQSILTTSNQFWTCFPQTSEQAQMWQFEGTPDYDVARALPG